MWVVPHCGRSSASVLVKPGVSQESGGAACPMMFDRGANERWEVQKSGEWLPGRMVDFKDMRWKALMVLDKLHKRDRRTDRRICGRGFQRGSGLAARMRYKGRPPTCVMPQTGQSSHGHAFGALTSKSCKKRTGLGNPPPQTTRKCWNCRSSPWTDSHVFPHSLARSSPRLAFGVDAIHPSMWSRISKQGKQLYTDMLNDVERTLTWLAQIQTLIYFLVPKTPTGERPIDLAQNVVVVWNEGSSLIVFCVHS